MENRISGPRLFLAIAYSIWETAHFGWHFFPSNDLETLADGIAFLLFSLSVLTIRSKGKDQP